MYRRFVNNVYVQRLEDAAAVDGCWRYVGVCCAGGASSAQEMRENCKGFVQRFGELYRCHCV